MSRRWLLCCDVTGTLIRVRQSVGAQYAHFVQKHAPAVELDEQRTTSMFMEEFSRASKQSPCFGATQGLSSRAWWQTVFCNTVQRSAAASVPVAALEAAFDEAYRAFGTRACWEMMPDSLRAMEALDTWRHSYGPTAVLSNFDERLPALLADLGLARMFDVIKTSRELGIEKPTVAAFEAVRSDPAVLLPAAQCIHIGDHATKDVGGAVAAGWQAIGVGTSVEHERVVNIPRLSSFPSAALLIMATS